MNTFGQRLKSLRRKKNLTQEGLASEFYINKTSISRYENNTQFPEMELLIQLADYFEVSIDYLLGRTDEPSLLSEKNSSKKTKDINSEDFSKILETLDTFSKIKDSNIVTVTLKNKHKIKLTLNELDFFVRYFDYLGIDIFRIFKKFNPQSEILSNLNVTDESLDVISDINSNFKKILANPN